MIRLFKFMLVGLGVSFFVFNTSTLTVHASTASEQIKKGVNTAAGKDDTAKTRDLTGIVEAVINTLSVIIGALAVIMLIFGGFRYVTSGGNDTAVASAKNTILYAIIGLIVVTLAQVIVHFVLQSLSQSTSSATISSAKGPGSSNDRRPSQKNLVDID